MGTGASNAQIAAALFMSEATVKAHVSHLFTKLALVNRVQLALHAHRVAPEPMVTNRPGTTVANRRIGSSRE